MSITNKSHPDLTELISKFVEASNRYLPHKPVLQDYKNDTSLAMSNNSKSDTARKCVLCSDISHSISKCSKYSNVELKINRLKELK